jgi:microcin C transport system permease protein
MVFPPIAFGPYASVNPDSIDVADVVTVRFNSMPMIGTVNVRQDFSIARAASFGPFIGKTNKEVRNLHLTDFFKIPESIRQAVTTRFSNESAAMVSAGTKSADGKETIISLATFSKRKKNTQDRPVNF